MIFFQVRTDILKNTVEHVKNPTTGADETYGGNRITDGTLKNNGHTAVRYKGSIFWIEINNGYFTATRCISNWQ